MKIKYLIHVFVLFLTIQASLAEAPFLKCETCGKMVRFFTSGHSCEKCAPVAAPPTTKPTTPPPILTDKTRSEKQKEESRTGSPSPVLAAPLSTETKAFFESDRTFAEPRPAVQTPIPGPSNDLLSGIIGEILDVTLPRVAGVSPSTMKDVLEAKNEGELAGAVATSLVMKVLERGIPGINMVILGLTPTEIAPDFPPLPQQQRSKNAKPNELRKAP